MSDRTWSPRWGRRAPPASLSVRSAARLLIPLPVRHSLWMAVCLLWLLDASNNTAMEPYRAFISDMLPKPQLARGFPPRARSSEPARSWRTCRSLCSRDVDRGFHGQRRPLLSLVFLARSDLLNRLGPDLCPVDEEIPRPMKSWRTFAPHRAGSGMRSPKSPTPFIRCPAGMHKIGLVFFFQ